MNAVQQELAELQAAGFMEVEVAAHLRTSESTVARWRKGAAEPALPQLVVAELRKLLKTKK